ncbi:hypothetical protein GALMADRAFT_249554 [Galerina marginata CBS 339.88]|uniref:F-box domain-containing protein n=1 Tax=Galerina marginata (strain CBS 339.88) TaxID=685588 RepID=A0A067T6K4_GALM3|nr:hypothetical protein GALMADRAFT_249554 [Galerina marginata CBS 339.88]
MPLGFAPFSHLSQELIDEIIDALFDPQEIERKISQFCACATVCRAFRHRAQKHAFYSMTPFRRRDSLASSRKRVVDFHNILQENPQIASYVRRLNLKMIDASGWLFDDPLFCEIMELISRTWAVEMRLELSVYGWGGNFQFTNNRRVETRFVKPFITPFITSLDLYSIDNIPLSLLAHCPHLVELRLVWVTVEAIRPLNAIDIDCSLRPRPRNFMFRSCGDTIRILETTYVDFGYLQRLSVSGFLYNELSNVKLILNAASSSLEHLQLEFEELEQGDKLDLYDLSKIPNLTFLSIYEVNLDDLDEEDSFVDVCNLLRTIPSEQTKIKTIALGFKGDLDNPFSLAAYLKKLEIGSGGPLCPVLAKLAERGPLVVKFMLDISLKYDADRNKEIWERRNTEMRVWIAKNLELTSLLSPNLCLEYDYEMSSSRSLF